MIPRFLILGCLLWPTLVSAQTGGGTRTLATLSSATCPGTGCVVASVIGLSGVGVQVTGTYSGTLTFEASLDGVTWVTLNLTPSNSTTAATSTTSTGVWLGAISGIAQVRIRCSSYTSGSADVTILTGPA